jgi:RNA polymerase sigma-70 factor (ECF subfamily)
MVLRADDPNDPQAAQALKLLCRTYWHPIYAYARRVGNSPHDAQDLTQGFFQFFLAKKLLDRVTPDGAGFGPTFLQCFGTIWPISGKNAQGSNVGETRCC